MKSVLELITKNIIRQSGLIARREVANMAEIKEISGAELESVLTNNDKVLVDFYEKNCGPCKMMAMILKEIAKGMEDVMIVTLEFNENREVAQQYDVNNSPYLILFQDGKEVSRLIGLQQKPVILKMLQA